MRHEKSILKNSAGCSGRGGRKPNIRPYAKLALIACAALLLFGCAVMPVSAADVPYQGQATLDAANIYHIATAAQLANLSEKVNAGSNYASGITFVLDSDIDLSMVSSNPANVTTTWAGGTTSWTPIGKDSNPFKGTFNGNYYTISNLNISSNADDQGLFGQAESMTIENVNVHVLNITGAQDLGGLVGQIVNGPGRITNCSCVISGIIHGTNNVGGLVGDAYSSEIITITNCSAVGNVTGSGNYVGGLVGNAYSYGITITITNCYAVGNVTGSGNYVGGLVGHNLGLIENCYAVCNVSGNQYVGGLVGSAENDGGNERIKICYAVGRVNGSSYVGGIGGSIGYVYYSVALTQYVNATSSVGRVAGVESTSFFAMAGTG